MFSRRRKILALGFAITLLVTVVMHRTEIRRLWLRPPALLKYANTVPQEELDSYTAVAPQANTDTSKKSQFQPGSPRPPGYNYTKMIVMPKRKADDTSWVDEELPDFRQALYVVDDWRAKLRPPKNKGNEVMVYLSYLIDFYDDLPDVSIFVHSHRWAWHNNDLLDGDTAMMIRHLSPERVIREGYMNLRCQWYPGCPDWLHPAADSEQEDKKEEALIAKAWKELFPGDPVPAVLAQPCCSQFALSRERIRAQPRAEYERLRSWLLHTKLRNSMSGRVFEYLWQVIFAGRTALCASMHACYCDGYGACFASEETFQAWFEARYNVRQDELDLMGYEIAQQAHDEYVRRGEWREAEKLEVLSAPEMAMIRQKINEGWFVLDDKRQAALKLGQDPAARAKVAGREWKEGDGF